MKITIISSVYAPVTFGGAEISAELLAVELVRAGHRVSVITLASAQAASPVETIDGVEVFRVDTGLPYDIVASAGQSRLRKFLWHGIDLWNPVAYRKVREILRSDRPDVVHTNVIAGFSTAVWRAAKSLGIPVVHTLRDYYLACARSNLYREESGICTQRCTVCRFAGAIRRRASRTPDRIVSISRFTLAKHREYGMFADVPATVIHNAFAPEGATAEPVRPARGGMLTALFMGRMEVMKGPQVILDALAKKPDLQVAVHLCGSGVLDSILRARSAHDRRVSFEGYVGGKVKEDLLRNAGVMLIPSVWYEPFNRSVVDAYRHGLALVASRIGGLPELVADGVTGRLFEPGNGEELAGILAELSAAPDRLEAMRASAAARAAEFEVGLHVSRYEEVYRQAVGG